MDEFDLERAPLEHSATGEQAAGPVRAFSSPSSAPVPAPFASRLSPRTRLLRAGSILVVLLLAVAMVVAVTPAARSAVIGGVFGPTPTSPPTPTPLPPGYDHIAVEDQVPWGTLLVDGQPVSALAPAAPATQSGLPSLPTFGLSRGAHQLEYRAAPFPVLRCTLSVPAAPHDTCPIDHQVIDYLVSTGQGTRLLDLRSTVDRLPAAQVAALAEATQRTLDAAATAAQDTLAPGDHYLGADGQVVVASVVLTAMPTYLLGAATSDTTGTIGGPGTPCATLCADGGPLAQSSPTDWELSAPVDIAWRYQTFADGHVVLANGPPGPAPAQQYVTIQVEARWIGGTGGAAVSEGTGGQGGQWQVRLLPTTAGVRDPVVCAVGAHYLDVLRTIPDQTTISFSDQSYQWPTQEWSSPPAPGCLFAGGRTVDNQGNLTGTVALVLYRYGALLAVNPEAQRVFPHLPLANPHEHALALAAWPPPTSTPSTGS
jgi:hypothetical protein